MKKALFSFCLTVLSLFPAASLMAGGIDNNTNWSIEYIRTFNRNAATDGADIVLYNPAGTTRYSDGLYANGSGHYVSKQYTNRIDGTDKNSNEPSVIPGLFAIYKKGRWAISGGYSIHSGGGVCDFQEGSQTTGKLGYAMMNPLLGLGGPGLVSGQRIKAESYYKGYTLGTAYQISDIVSLSLGVRYIDAHREARISTTLTNSGGVNSQNAAFEENAAGWGGIFGLNISPADPVNIGIRYETGVDLDFKQSVSQDSLGLIPFIGRAFGVTHGGVVSRDLPAILGLGASYQMTPRVRMESNLTWYFNRNADWQGKEDKVNDGFDLGLMLEYKFNEKWLASVGYLYTRTGMEPEDMTPEAPELDAHTIGAGFAYRPATGLTLNFGVGNAFYPSDSFTYSPAAGISDKVAYKKNNFIIGFGFEYKLM
ncbi:MAG: outer membrane protein transport protein [Desulfobacterales bacterium]|nr:outer membrane protein transport protein [Desulfobacterales bacterium]